MPGQKRKASSGLVKYGNNVAWNAANCCADEMERNRFGMSPEPMIWRGVGGGQGDVSRYRSVGLFMGGGRRLVLRVVI